MKYYQFLDYEGSIVRVLKDNGEVYFCAKDLGNIFNLATPGKAYAKIPDSEKVFFNVYSLDGGNPKKTLFLTRFGAYMFVFRVQLKNEVNPVDVAKWIESVCNEKATV